MIRHRIALTALALLFASTAHAKAPAHLNGGLDPWVELDAEARKAAEDDARRLAARPAPEAAEVEKTTDGLKAPEVFEPPREPAACPAAALAQPEPEPEPALQMPEPDPDDLEAPEPEPLRVPTPEPAFAEMAEPPQAAPEPEPEAIADALDDVIPLTKPDARRLSEAIVEASNEARQHHGLPAVEPDFRLHRAAAGHAHRMARLGFFAHRDPHAADRRTPTDRARSAGIANPAIAENIATALVLDLPTDEPLYVIDADRGLFSKEANGAPVRRRTYRQFGRHVVRRWLASPGHRRNLLSTKALQIGAAAAPFKQAGGIPSLTAVQVFQWYHPVKSPD